MCFVIENARVTRCNIIYDAFEISGVVSNVGT